MNTRNVISSKHRRVRYEFADDTAYKVLDENLAKLYRRIAIFLDHPLAKEGALVDVALAVLSNGDHGIYGLDILEVAVAKYERLGIFYGKLVLKVHLKGYISDQPSLWARAKDYGFRMMTFTLV
jgi:hypothetical protein